MLQRTNIEKLETPICYRIVFVDPETGIGKNVTVYAAENLLQAIKTVLKYLPNYENFLLKGFSKETSEFITYVDNIENNLAIVKKFLMFPETSAIAWEKYFMHIANPALKLRWGKYLITIEPSITLPGSNGLRIHYRIPRG